VGGAPAERLPHKPMKKKKKMMMMMMKVMTRVQSKVRSPFHRLRPNLRGCVETSPGEREGGVASTLDSEASRGDTSSVRGGGRGLAPSICEADGGDLFVQLR